VSVTGAVADPPVLSNDGLFGADVVRGVQHLYDGLIGEGGARRTRIGAIVKAVPGKVLSVDCLSAEQLDLGGGVIVSLQTSPSN
jgi:hypothetical protein